MRPAITVSVIEVTLLACLGRYRRGGRAAHGRSAGNLPELLAHSSSQGEDRGQHSCRKVAMERLMSTRLFQAKTQDAGGLFAGLDELASGSLTEMLEILGGAGVGREDFKHRTRGERLQRPSRLQHRQRAEQPGGIEGSGDFTGRIRHDLSLAISQGES